MGGKYSRSGQTSRASLKSTSVLLRKTKKAAPWDGNSEKSLLLAERGGFEPPKTYGLTAFRERPVQPLLHLSMQLPYFTSIPQEFPEALPQPQSHPRNGGF